MSKNIVTKNKVAELVATILDAKLNFEQVNELIDRCIELHRSLLRVKQQNAMSDIEIGKLYEFSSRRTGMLVTVRVDAFNIKTVSGHEVVNGHDIYTRKWKVSPTMLRPAARQGRNL